MFELDYEDDCTLILVQEEMLAPETSSEPPPLPFPLLRMKSDLGDEALEDAVIFELVRGRGAAARASA